MIYTSTSLLKFLKTYSKISKLIEIINKKINVLYKISSLYLIKNFKNIIDKKIKNIGKSLLAPINHICLHIINILISTFMLCLISASQVLCRLDGSFLCIDLSHINIGRPLLYMLH